MGARSFAGSPVPNLRLELSNVKFVSWAYPYWSTRRGTGLLIGREPVSHKLVRNTGRFGNEVILAMASGLAVFWPRAGVRDLIFADHGNFNAEYPNDR